MCVTSQKMVETWLPAKRIQKFEAERWQTSAVSAHNGIPQQSSET